MRQFLLLPMPDMVTQIFSSVSLACLQCGCSVAQAGTKGKILTRLQSRSQGKNRQPWPKPPCISFRKSFPQGHQLHYLWIGPEPGRMGRGSGPWHVQLAQFCPYWSPLTASPHIFWPNALVIVFLKQDSASKGRSPQLTTFVLPSCHP